MKLLLRNYGYSQRSSTLIQYFLVETTGHPSDWIVYSIQSTHYTVLIQWIEFCVPIVIICSCLFKVFLQCLLVFIWLLLKIEVPKDKATYYICILASCLRWAKTKQNNTQSGMILFLFCTFNQPALPATVFHPRCMCGDLLQSLELSRCEAQNTDMRNVGKQ